MFRIQAHKNFAFNTAGDTSTDIELKATVIGAYVESGILKVTKSTNAVDFEDVDEISFPYADTLGSTDLSSLTLTSDGSGTLYCLKRPTGQSSEIVKSTDGGEVWTGITTNPDSAIVGIKYINGELWAINSLSKLYYSTNGGTSWSSYDLRAFITGQPGYQYGGLIKDIVYTGTSYIGVGYYYDSSFIQKPLVVRSTNKTTWSIITGYTEADYTYFNTITYDGTHVVITGKTLGKIFYSDDDGLTYTETTAGSSETGEFTSIISDSLDTLVATGLYITGVQRSTDNGETWSRVTSGLSSTYIRNVIYAESQFVAVANKSDKLVALTSSNGSSWTERALEDSYDEGVDPWNYCINHDGTDYVIVGDARASSGDFYVESQSSPDAVTWTKLDLDIGVSNLYSEAYCVSTDGKGNWAIGLENSSYIYSFDDGETWSKMGNVPGSTSRAVSGIIWNEGASKWFFICYTRVSSTASLDVVPTLTYSGTVGAARGCGIAQNDDGSDMVFAYSSGSENVANSTNFGSSWTLRTADDSYTDGFFSVVYGSDKFLVGGEDGSIQSSSNGTTWVTQATGLGEIYSLIWDGESFYAFTDTQVAKSNFGTTWVTQSGTAPNIREIEDSIPAACVTYGKMDGTLGHYYYIAQGDTSPYDLRYSESAGALPNVIYDGAYSNAGQAIGASAETESTFENFETFSGSLPSTNDWSANLEGSATTSQSSSHATKGDYSLKLSDPSGSGHDNYIFLNSSVNLSAFDKLRIDVTWDTTSSESVFLSVDDSSNTDIITVSSTSASGVNTETLELDLSDTTADLTDAIVTIGFNTLSGNGDAYFDNLRGVYVLTGKAIGDPGGPAPP